MNDSYQEFLNDKAQLGTLSGFKPVFVPDTLFDFQKHVADWAIRKGKAAIFADCGLGKTPIQLTWAENVTRKKKKPVLILTPLAVASQTLAEANKFGIEAHRIKDGKVQRGINIVNYDKLHQLNPADFAGCVCDECFAKGTPVDTPNGKKYIEDIRCGDEIYNATGIDIVSDVHRREVPYAVKVKANGQDCIVSPNHPFLTQRGWVGAQNLQPGDSFVTTREAMRMVLGFVFEGDVAAAQRRKILREILFSEMADASTGDHRQDTQPQGRGEAWQEPVSMVELGQSKSQDRDGQNSGIESFVSSRSASENIPHVESHEAQTFRAWGQWPWANEASGSHDGCAWRRMDSGICFVTGPTNSDLSHSLQDGLSQSCEENLRRGGWELSLREKAFRQKEGCEIGVDGVDGIEILEQGHSELGGLRDADGKLYFYDLGATRHPSFSVNGWLVHNSSILKSFDGARRVEITEFMKKMEYRLLCTATAAPNEYIELGTSSEALGELGYMDMLMRFFKNDQNTIRPMVYRQRGKNFAALDEGAKWRFKGHAETPFWRWTCSWALTFRKPSDLGFSDEGFALPELIERAHVVKTNRLADGMLFALPAVGLHEQREERRRSIEERCEKAAEIASQHGSSVAWCHLNPEGDLLEKLIPDCVQVSGRDSEEAKEEKLIAFQSGQVKRLITKSKIAGWGLNWQHCHHMTTFPSHSFEQYYQSVRRFLRFGQEFPVEVDIVTTEGESSVLENQQRKAKAADKMFSALVENMGLAQHINRSIDFTKTEEIPTWLS